MDKATIAIATTVSFITLFGTLAFANGHISLTQLVVGGNALITFIAIAIKQLKKQKDLWNKK